MKYKNILIVALTTVALIACKHEANELAHHHDHGHEHDEHMHEEDGEEHEHEHEHGANDIVIEPEDAKKFGIETEKVSLQPFNNVIQVTGQLVNASTDEATVTATTPGIVTLSGSIEVGKSVGAGQAFASISSQGISGGDPNAAARVAVNAAKAELDRLTPLLAEGIVTQKEYNAAKAAYDAARASFSSGAASGKVTTPISGVVTQLLVKSGQYVEAGTPIAVVSKNSSLMLRADLPEKYRTMLSNIVGANMRTSYSNSWVNIDAFKGHRVEVAQGQAAARTGYIPVYFTLENDGTLSSGSYADVCLITNVGSDAIVVPTEAISEQQGAYFVYVKESEHCYEKRRVTLGESNGSETAITSGLEPGDEVVVKGAIMVKLAESSGAVPEGHSHSH